MIETCMLYWRLEPSPVHLIIPPTPAPTPVPVPAFIQWPDAIGPPLTSSPMYFVPDTACVCMCVCVYVCVCVYECTSL